MIKPNLELKFTGEGVLNSQNVKVFKVFQKSHPFSVQQSPAVIALKSILCNLRFLIDVINEMLMVSLEGYILFFYDFKI